MNLTALRRTYAAVARRYHEVTGEPPLPLCPDPNDTLKHLALMRARINQPPGTSAPVAAAAVEFTIDAQTIVAHVAMLDAEDRPAGSIDVLVGWRRDHEDKPLVALVTEARVLAERIAAQRTAADIPASSALPAEGATS